jgi:predicted nucleic acid-binding protein
MSGDPPMLYVAEPPPGYLVLPPLVVDCSVMVAAMFEEAARDQAIALMSGKLLFAPTLLAHEMVNVAARKLRAGSPPDRVRQALSDFGAHAIELRPTDPMAQFDLALRYDLSGYDAAYLWLAAELKSPLVTFDKKLAAAAQAHLSGLT